MVDDSTTITTTKTQISLKQVVTGKVCETLSNVDSYANECHVLLSMIWDKFDASQS